MRVAVLGGGNGSMAVAGEWALAGHEVRIAELESHRGSMEGVAEAGAITLAGKLEGQAPIASCGVDVGEALAGAAALSAPADGVPVTLSRTAQALEPAGRTQGEFDANRVKAMRAAIEGGTFKVNAGAIADKLLTNAQEVLSRSKD